MTTPSIDEIIHRVKAEAERRRQSPTAAAVLEGAAHSGAARARSSSAAAVPVIPAKKKYVLDEFLRLGDEAFVRAAYQGLLRREPDPQGLANYLRRLRGGRASKTDILIGLRWSLEGRNQGVKVSGLKRLRRWRSVSRLPILGPTMLWLWSLARLSKLWREVRRQDAWSEKIGYSWENAARALQQRSQSQEDSVLALRNHLEELQGASTSAIAGLRKQILEISEQFMELRDLQVAEREEIEKQRQYLQKETQESREKLQCHSAELLTQRSDVLAFQRRLTSVLEKFVHNLGGGGIADETTEQNPYNSLYVDFEDAFRGDYSEVRERLSLYRPLVEQACEAAGSKRLLDLGCGRGEWLDLFTESGYEASGVDLNESMVSLCLAKGLDAVQGDVLTELLRQPDAAFSVVSMFHLVEHLPFEAVLRVVDEVHRVLRPGGIAIFETPNPRNILVGSGDFYRDPTHRNPVFPDTIAWLGRARGFADSRIVFVDYAGQKLIAAEDWSFGSLEDYVNVPRDYAWIGTKG